MVFNYFVSLVLYIENSLYMWYTLHWEHTLCTDKIFYCYNTITFFYSCSRVFIVTIEQTQHIVFYLFSLINLGKCYFDTGFSLTSIWHSNVAVLSRMTMKEKTRMVLAYVVYLCLFAKGVFCHLPSENTGQFERDKQISFRIALITPACSEGERTEETARFAFLLPPSCSFSTVAFVFHCHLHFPAANPPSHWSSLIRCWYETLLVVFVWVLRSCLIIVSSCAFYGYRCECVVFFMLKNHILVCFLVVGLHLCLVVEVVYVHYLCLVVMHVCLSLIHIWRCRRRG